MKLRNFLKRLLFLPLAAVAAPVALNQNRTITLTKTRAVGKSHGITWPSAPPLDVDVQCRWDTEFAGYTRELTSRGWRYIKKPCGCVSRSMHRYEIGTFSSCDAVDNWVKFQQSVGREVFASIDSPDPTCTYHKA